MTTEGTVTLLQAHIDRLNTRLDTLRAENGELRAALADVIAEYDAELASTGAAYSLKVKRALKLLHAHPAP